VAVVLQETILFSGTIRDNIRWGKSDATEEEIIAAAKAAQAHDFIMELPKQYDTELGQRGINVSGGQKQRISIARALIQNPAIIIFDDSTSAVDSLTEKNIRQSMKESHNECTKFIIAQRISSIRHADKILVLSGGKIVALASPAFSLSSTQKGRVTIKPYDGIEEVLKNLKESGVKLAVCTSKLEETAHTVVRELGLYDYFDAVCGSNIECTRKDKKDLIPYAVECLGGNLKEAVMLGDTWYDAKGAMECGVDFIACSYGYGADEDMAKYNPVAWAENTDSIVDKL
jgi:HAD superfamily hydrolase (TIGR01549 family)